MKRATTILLTIIYAVTAWGEPADTTAATPRKSWVKSFLDYFNDANKNKNNKKFDFSIIGGPHYSTDTELGLGLVAAGLYRNHDTDSLLPPSNVSIFGDVSTVGFYMLGVRGTNIFPHDRYRLSYTTFFYSFPSDFWGIGFDNGNDDGNKSEMRRWQAKAKVTLLRKLGDNLYAGPSATFDYVRGSRFERPELLGGMDS